MFPSLASASKNLGMPLVPSIGKLTSTSHQFSGTMLPSLASASKNPGMPLVPSIGKLTSTSHQFSGTMFPSLAGASKNPGLPLVPSIGKLTSTSHQFSGTMLPSLASASKNPGMPLVPSIGKLTSTSHHFSGTMFSTLAGASKNPGLPLVPSIGKLTSTSHHFSGTMFSTLAGASKNPGLPLVPNMERGDSDDLCRRFSAEVDHTEVAVHGFEERYISVVKHMLAARCLIAPNGLYDPSTVFLHIQTYKIAKYNPNYLSIFDVMSYEHGVRDSVEWNLFLEYLVQKRIYIIEDWNLSLSSIEILVYDHGIKSVDDGTKVDIYKGECDASFNRGIAKLSYFIWKGDSIVWSEIFMDIRCDSATEAEIFVGFALISKAKELEIQKLLVCSDCLTLCKILNGQLVINNIHPQRNKYLMIRSMKRHFKNLIATWKPRELMVFADELAKSDENDPLVIKKIFQKWPYHLKGLPVFRIERTEILNKAIKKFAKTYVDDSFGTTADSVFYIRVEEENKLDCIVGIKQSLAPYSLLILVSNIDDKSPGFIMDLTKILDNPLERKYGDCTCFY